MNYFIKKYRIPLLVIFTLLGLVISGKITIWTIGGFTGTLNGKTSLYSQLNNKNNTKAPYSETITEQIASEGMPKAIRNSFSDVKFNGYGAYIISNNTPNLEVRYDSEPYARNSLDSLGRPATSEAIVNKSTREYSPRTDFKDTDVTLTPLGYHQRSNLKGNYPLAYNRGHLLGYAIIGNLPGFDASENNKQNIITQTVWANQASESTNTGQNYYESLVRQAQDQNRTISYRVTPMYIDNELVPRGVQLEALSSDSSLKFNVYIPNVQGNIIIDYKTGHTTPRN